MSDFEYEHVIFCAEEWAKITEKQYQANIDGACVIFTIDGKKEKFFYHKDTILGFEVNHYYTHKRKMCTTIPDRIMRKEIMGV